MTIEYWEKFFEDALNGRSTKAEIELAALRAENFDT